MSSNPTPLQSESLRRRGIIKMPGGTLRLPPIRIEYADGSSQNLLLDVGGRRSETSVSSASFLTDLLLNRRSNVLSPVTSPGLGATRLRPLSGNRRSHLSQSLTSSLLSPGSARNQGVSHASTSTSTSTARAETPIRGPTDSHSTTPSNTNETPSSTTDGPVVELAQSQALRSGEATPASGAGESQASSTQSDHIASTTGGEQAERSAPSATSGAHSETSRNIILTVNYIYGQTPVNNHQGASGSEGANDVNGGSQSGITGSLILHVPSINESNDDNLQVLVRLATIIALRTISTSIKKASGVPDKVFKAFKVCKLDELAKEDRKCPICYDAYIDPIEEKKKAESVSNSKENSKGHDKEDTVNLNGKRARKSEENSPNKRRKTNSEVNGSSSYTPVAKGKEDADSKEKEKEEYVHVPVKMPCGHVFGRTCLHEWLKTNNSCPLCRDKIKHTRGSESGYATTVVLPNLAQVISESREVIQDFNSRSLIFSLPDQDGNELNNAEQRSQEVTFPAAVPIRFPTIVTLNPLAANGEANIVGSNGAANTTAGNARRRNGSPGVMRLVRELIQSLHNRLHQPIRLRDDQGSRRDLQNGVLDHLPIIRPVSGSNADVNRRVNESVQHVRMRFIPQNGASTANHDTGANTLFPIGVASRRTPNGVVTTSVGGIDADTTNETTSNATEAISNATAQNSAHSEQSQNTSSDENPHHSETGVEPSQSNSNLGHSGNH